LERAVARPRAKSLMARVSGVDASEGEDAGYRLISRKAEWIKIPASRIRPTVSSLSNFSKVEAPMAARKQATVAPHAMPAAALITRCHEGFMAMRRTIRRFGPGVISMRAYGKTSEVNNVTMIVQGAFLTGRLRLIDTACPEAVEGKEREPQVNKSKVSRTANCGCPISNDKARAGPHEREPHPHTHPYCPQKRWLDRFSRSSHQAVCWQVHITILPSIERETAVKWNDFMLCRSLFSPFPNSGHVVRDRKSKDFVEFDRLDRQRERFRRRSRSSRRCGLQGL
jgi:hypothetical protein